MPKDQSAAFDPATLQLLRSLLDEIWEDLPTEHRAKLPKSYIASDLLRLAQRGQIEPQKLKADMIATLELRILNAA
jgi:hypothetical protein